MLRSTETISNSDGYEACSHAEFWLIPTAEVPLTNLVREDIIDEAKLPHPRHRCHTVLPRRGRRRG